MPELCIFCICCTAKNAGNADVFGTVAAAAHIDEIFKCPAVEIKVSPFTGCGQNADGKGD